MSDESVSALDVSVRGQVLDLLLELQEEMGLAYLFISHDMAVIERMSHDVAVMRGGEFVEYGTRRQVFENPAQDYTKALMRAVPVPFRAAEQTVSDPCCSRYEFPVRLRDVPPRRAGGRRIQVRDAQKAVHW